MYREILVPAGPNPDRKTLLEHVRELASTYDARVHVMHVVDLVDRGSFGEDEEPEDEGREAVEEMRDDLQATGLETLGEVREGTPYEEILDYAETEGIDLVVMGTHGKQGLTRMLLGSTAEEVIRRSPVPVLTVKG